MEREEGYGDHDAIMSPRLMCLLKTGPKLFLLFPVLYKLILRLLAVM